MDYHNDLCSIAYKKQKEEEKRLKEEEREYQEWQDDNIETDRR